MDKRTGPLTWGQYLPWVAENAAPENNPYFKMVIADLLVPPGLTADEVVSVLDKITTRYEGLRTTFEEVAVTCRQVVQPARPRGYRVVVSEAEPTDADPPADTVAWLTQPFDLANEWPVRAALWRRLDGRWILRLAVSRMILDREGMIVFRMHFYRACQTGSIDADVDQDQSVAWEPIDIAEFEQSPAGQRRDNRAFTYWRRGLTTAPETLFATARPGRASDSRFTVYLAQADLRHAVRKLAAAFRVTEPTVLTAVALLALSWTGRSSRVVATVVSNNRGRREIRRSLSPMLDRGLMNVVVDPALTFSAWVDTVATASLAAFQHTHADPNSVLRAYGEVSIERGILLDRLPILNIFGREIVMGSREAGQSADAPIVPDEYRASAKAGHLDGVYLRAQIMWRTVTIELLAGEQIFDLATAERVVALFPAVLTALDTAGDMTVGKLAELTRDDPTGDERVAPELAYVDHTRVDLAAVRTLLGECAGVTDAAVFIRPDSEGRHRLHAFVVGDDRLRDLARLRTAVMGRLPAHRRVLCPHWFQVVPPAPSRPGSYDAWAALPVLTEGTGRSAGVVAPASPQEKAVAAALTATHPDTAGEAVDLGLPYCLAGGRFERIPAFLGALARGGVTDVSVDDLMSTTPLAGLVALDRHRQPR